MTGTFERRPEHIKFSGRILFLTEDTSLIRQQLEARDEAATTLETELAGRLLEGDLPLMSNISTDEITPGWVCFYYDETLGQYVYAGMRDGAVKKDEVKNGGFAVVVSGLSKGCGSSRETAPYAEKAAGVGHHVALSVVAHDNPYEELMVRGTVVEVRADPDLADMHPIAHVYTWRDFPFNSGEQVTIVIEPDWVFHQSLPFEPAATAY